MQSDVSRTMCFGDRCQARLRSSSYDVAAFAFDPACLAEAGAASEGWWSQTGSNRRPHACKARALPAELWPRTRRRMLDWLAEPKLASTGPPSPIRLRRGSLARLRERRLVGLGRLELPTSRLSSA